VSSADPDDAGIGKLIERFWAEPLFRARFRADPVGVCRAEGLDDLADELSRAGTAMHTLELRESRSSMAGVVVAVAAESVAVAELRGLVGHALPGPARENAMKALRVAGVKTPGAHVVRAERNLAPSGEATRLQRGLGGQGATRPVTPGSASASGSSGGSDAPTPGSATAAATPGRPGGGTASASGSATSGGTSPTSGASADTARSGAGGVEAMSRNAASPGTGGGGAAGAAAGGAAGLHNAASGGGGGGTGQAVAGAALAGGSGGGSGGLAALLSSPRLSLPSGARAMFASGDADPRLTSLLESAVAHHTIVIGDMESAVEPVHAQAIDIVSVDGEPVSPSNVAARDLTTEIAALDPSERPNEIGTPWPIQAQGFYTDAAHQGRLHIAFVSHSDYAAGGAGGTTPPRASDAGAGGSGPVAATPAAQGVAQAAAAQISADNASRAARPAMQIAADQQASSTTSSANGAGQRTADGTVQSGSERGTAGGSGQAPAGGSGQAPVPQRSGGYVYPLPSTRRIGRTDMGVDVDLNPGDPISAPGTSRVLGVTQDWYAGQPYLALQLLDGPMKGRNYYVAEQIDISVIPGQTVQAGQTIAHYAASGTGVEMGWAAPNWQQTLAQAEGNTGDAHHNDAPAGISFRTWLDSLSSKQSSVPAAGDAPGSGSAGVGSGSSASAGGGKTGAAGAGAAAGAGGAGGGGLVGGGAARGGPAQPAQGTGVFKAAKPHERHFHRNTVQFLPAVQPGPESPLYRAGQSAEASAQQQEDGQGGVIGGQAALGQAGVSGGQPSGQSGGGLIDQQPAQGAGIAQQPSGGAITVRSSRLTSGQEKFVGRLAQQTGLAPRVVAAWALAEESDTNARLRQAENNNDWLNIGYTDSANFGTGDSIWSDPIKAADATAGWLKGRNTIPGYGIASSGVQAILRTAGQPAEQQMMAIANSGWASSHYDSGRNLLGTYSELGDLRIARA
jgi:hypothetical protein